VPHLRAAGQGIACQGLVDALPQLLQVPDPGVGPVADAAQQGRQVRADRLGGLAEADRGQVADLGDGQAQQGIEGEIMSQRAAVKLGERIFGALLGGMA
jgi:hypothetical protein